MIKWDLTETKFGYSETTALSKNVVVVECDNCGQLAERTLCSIRQTIKKTGAIRCHSCATKSKAFSDSCAERALKLWQNADYVHNVLEAVQSGEYRDRKRQESLARWQDQSFRAKMLSPEMGELRRTNSSKAIKIKWADQEYRSKIIHALRERMVRIWQDHDYRAHMREIQIATTKELWNAGIFNDCFDSDFASKMGTINREILARPEVLTKLSIAGKSNWLDQEYRDAVVAGNKSKWQDPQHRVRMAQIRANQPRLSNLQTMLYNYLDDLGVTYFREGSDTVIGYYTFDCLIPAGSAKKLLIECQGDYWHSLEPGRDRAKFTYIQKYFPEYEIMYLWEHEFYAKDRVLDRLKLKLGIHIQTVDFNFSDIEIKPTTSTEVGFFLDQYHYIGRGRGGITIGAYHGDQLVAIAVFSSPLRQNQEHLHGKFRELSRFCIHPSYHKKNFASWLLSKFIARITDVDTIIAYSDTTVGHDGGIYRAANFKFSHDVPPDYWYVDKDGFVMHKRTLYGRASKMSLTEAEFAKQFGYVKQYGGHKKCCVYKHPS